MGRPRKEINWEMVERYAQAGCSGIEIAASFGMQDDTFYRIFKEQYGESFQDYKGRANRHGEGELKLMQYAKALNNKAPGNIQMLMFLGKVRLKQDDAPIGKQDANNQSTIDIQHRNMELEAEIEQLRTDIAALQNVPEAE